MHGPLVYCFYTHIYTCVASEGFKEQYKCVNIDHQSIKTQCQVPKNAKQSISMSRKFVEIKQNVITFQDFKFVFYFSSHVRALVARRSNEHK